MNEIMEKALQVLELLGWAVIASLIPLVAQQVYPGYTGYIAAAAANTLILASVKVGIIARE